MGLFGSKKERNNTVLEIDGMTCNHCVMRVTKALEGIKSVKEAKVSLADKKADVSFKSAKVDDKVLVDAVEEAGYKAKAK